MKILLEKYSIYNQLEQKNTWKSFITPTQEVALVQHFLSNKVAREKLEPTLSSNWNFKAVIMIPSFRRR